jgi:hypothetical protein
VAYREARRAGHGNQVAMDAAEQRLREVWPELTPKEASAEVVSAHHTKWLWDGVGSR